MGLLAGIPWQSDTCNRDMQTESLKSSSGQVWLPNLKVYLFSLCFLLGTSAPQQAFREGRSRQPIQSICRCGLRCLGVPLATHRRTP